MILYYFPIAQNTGNKTVSDFFHVYVCAHIFIFSIYWSDTSLWLDVRDDISEKKYCMFSYKSLASCSKILGINALPIIKPLYLCCRCYKSTFFSIFLNIYTTKI